MPTQMTLADCVRLAEFAHFHQKDKSGADYIDHPKRVLRAVQDEGAPPYVQMAAVLHDVTEDTPFTPEMLREFGVPEAAVHLVTLLDRDISRNTYMREVATVTSSPTALWWTGSDYVPQSEIPTRDEFYYAAINRSAEARRVKLADIRDNLLPWRLVYLSPEKQQYLRAKYAKALLALGQTA